MGLSQMQFCIISAMANDLHCKPASVGEQEVGGVLGSDSKGPCHSYNDMAALRPPSPTTHTLTQRTVDEIPMPPGCNPGLDRWVGQIDMEHASTGAPIQPESPIIDTSNSNSDEGQ